MNGVSIPRLLEVFNELGAAFRSVCLFGSRATGRDTEESDYDWFLVLNDEHPSRKSVVGNLGPLRGGLKALTKSAHHFVIRSKIDLEKFEPLHASLARDGIILRDDGTLLNVLRPHLLAMGSGRLSFKPLPKGGELIVYDRIA